MVMIKEYYMDGNKIKVMCKTMVQQFNVYLNLPVNQLPYSFKKVFTKTYNLSKKNKGKES